MASLRKPLASAHTSNASWITQSRMTMMRDGPAEVPNEIHPIGLGTSSIYQALHHF